MIIQFQFPDQSLDLRMDLVDNPAIDSWARHFSRGFSGRANIQDHNKCWPHDDLVLTHELTKCGQVLDNLARWGYKYEGSWPRSRHAISRDFTNGLHRFFTYYQDQVNRVQWSDLSADAMAEKKRVITDLLQQVNEHVHTIERYLPAVPDVSGYDLREIYISNESLYDDANWWTMHSSHRQYHSDQHADVILGSQILGKTILRSYLDGDNPNDWDTSGHYANNGCLQLLLNDDRQKIYQSDHFNHWLSRHGMIRDRVFFDFPVGNFPDRSLLPTIRQKLIGSNNLVPVQYFTD